MFATCFRYTVSYFGRREKFHAPLLKSVIDTVVFGHDLDFSNDKTCNETFKAVARAARGKDDRRRTVEERRWPGCFGKKEHC